MYTHKYINVACFYANTKKKVEQTAHSIEKIYHNTAEMAVVVNIYLSQT